MKAVRKSIPFVILLCGVLGLVSLSRLKKDPLQASRTKQSALVEVASVEACDTGFEITVDGEVIPYREINLAAEVSGRIAKKSPNARAGTYVRKGELLFEIDKRDYELEVRRLRETVKQAGSSIEELDVEETNARELVALAKERLELQRNEVERFEGLKKKNATSTSQLENVRQAELDSKNSLQSLHNQITLIKARRNRLAQEQERAQTNLAQSELKLSRTEIRSPIDGIVIQDFAEQDDFVQPGGQLVRLEDTSRVEVRFSLRMDQLRWLWGSGSSPTEGAAVGGYTYELPKVPVEVGVELGGNRFSWPARLDRYDGAGITSGTRTVPVIAVVDDPTSVRVAEESGALPLAAPPTLLRGSYVAVEIPVGKGMNLVSVPAPAFQPNRTVWVFQDGVLHIQAVRAAYADNEKVVLMTDPALLAEGDLVVTSPLPVAEEGMQLRFENASADEAEPGPEHTITVSESSDRDTI